MKRYLNWHALLPSLLLIAVLLSFAGIGTALAKYVTQAELQGNVTISAHLGSIAVKEHKVDRQTDGSYTLNDSVEVTKNDYIILPGVDIPKDPFVTVTDKSGLPAYVYVEIVDELLNNALSYEVDLSNWTKLSVTGKHGGTVYVYKEQVTANIGPIYILKNNQVIVGQELLHGTANGLALDFYASMYQVASGNDAADVYNKNS